MGGESCWATELAGQPQKQRSYLNSTLRISPRGMEDTHGEALEASSTTDRVERLLKKYKVKLYRILGAS